jgi:hypothetical protein
MRIPICIAVAVLAGCSDSNSPDATLRNVHQAFQEQDRLALEAYVDLGRVASTLVDEARRSGEINHDLDDCLPTDANCLSMVLDQYTTTITEYIQRLASGEKRDMVMDFFNDVTIRIDRARAIEATAAADVVLTAKERQRWYPDSVVIVTRLEKTSDNRWRVVGIENGMALEKFLSDRYYSRR